ncbi:hypothetical protein TD95_005184 [Thielaviopsis punctulata]|uniref:Life-span regulatory factor domain-containing protein n=1 Tax=Thielaviopsis punctulata TaxID=72032 RepID=A0A0F4ZB82_9PEZI|nr:hypothetical protein TD95_005184 [Thielaviopsis punctulata]
MAFESFDLWTHPFCLCCDKQTEGAAYCSEACRLADFEKPAAPAYSSSLSSDLGSSWASRHGAGKFCLSPAYDFSSALTSSSSSPSARSSYCSSGMASPSYYSASWSQQQQQQQPARSLSPSSSHTSLSSIDSAACKRDSLLISEKSRRELQDYAKQFEHARSNRRRSY